MALRAGYYGIKDYLVKKLKLLPPIKTIGSGLSLSNKGVLTVTGGAGSGSSIKVKTATYTGTGVGSTSSFSLSDGDGDKLLFVLAIDAENELNTYHVDSCSPGSWSSDRYIISIGANYSERTTELGAISLTGDLVQLNGGTIAGACNIEDVVYRMKYVIDENATPPVTKKKSK